MCIDGKTEVEACKTLIPCFTGTLARWWELESSPTLIEKMEQEVLKDENGDIKFHEDGRPINNMIGALTALIQQKFCGDDPNISDQNEMILMNLKCKNIKQYEDFHRDWIQRIFMVKDPKNLLWKQVYLVALPSKLVDILKLQEAFQLPLEAYLWCQMYSIITRVLITLCTSSKINKSIDKLNRLPGTQSFCSKYGITVDDPLVKKRKSKKKAKKTYRRSQLYSYDMSTKNISELKHSKPHRKPYQKPARRGYSKYTPKTHYYEPHDIHPRSEKMKRMQEQNYWICGKTGHTSHMCHDVEESRKGLGKKTQQKYKGKRQVKTEVTCTRCGSLFYKTEDCHTLMLQQAQAQSSSVSSSDYSSSESDIEKVHAYCECSDSDNCKCHCSSSDSGFSSDAQLAE